MENKTIEANDIRKKQASQAYLPVKFARSVRTVLAVQAYSAHTQQQRQTLALN